MYQLDIICRICLGSDRKTYDLRKCNLVEIYEFLCGQKVSDFACVSRVCCECAVLLKKANCIRTRCHEANKMLSQVIKEEDKISKTAIMKYMTEEKKNLNFWHKDRHHFRKARHKKSNKKDQLTSSDKIPHDLYIDHLDIPESDVSKMENVGTDVIDEIIHNNSVESKILSEVKGMTLPTLDLKNHQMSDEDIKKEIKEEMYPDCAEITDLSECSTDDSEKPIPRNRRSMRTKKKKRILRKTLNKDRDKPSRKDLEILRQLDRRYKNSDEFDDEFVVERFLTEEEQRSEFEKRRFSESYTESRYKCESCLKGFREQKLLDVHNKKHERSSGDYLCEICQVRLPTAKRFRTHRDGNHTAKYSCKRCAFVTFNKAQARNHHTWHQGVEHKCPHCSMSFRKYTTFMGHLRLNHPSRHICSTCAHSFVSPYGLHLHRKVVHKNDPPSDSSTEKSYCVECDVQFDTYNVYIKHILISPKHKDLAGDIIGCRDCGQEFDSRQELEKHSHRSNSEKCKKDAKDFKCTQCDQRFAHPTSVYQHFIRAHPDTPYKMARSRHDCLCEQCGKTFMCQSKLLAHKRLHTGERPYSCPQCDKAFRTKVYLTKHINSHEGLRQHRCKVCGKCFSNAGNLFKHMRIHAGVKPFKCDICEKAFVDSSNLRQHVQGVHFNVRRTRKR